MHWTQKPGGRKKLATAMRRGWTKRKNGHEGTVIELAKEGARRRLQDIEREANTLRIFLGEVPQAPGVRK